MFLDDPKNRKNISKWTVATVAACILIFLAIRYISAIALAVQWLIDLVKPLLIGTLLAMFLSVPLVYIEKHLFRKKPTPRKEKARRPVAILLTLILVLGILISIAVLVIPELLGAVSIVFSSITGGLDQLAAFESSADFAAFPFAEQLKSLDIDWLTMKTQLENWVQKITKNAFDTTATALGGIAASFLDGIVAFAFCIYVLANKETLSRQISRLAYAWLPKRFNDALSHVFSVCANTFRQFMVGQTTEAILLGTLCGVGMAILRIPYAPMVGALVGVTALIPYVGAFLSTIVGAFMILTVNPFKALVFVIFLLTLQQIEGNLIYPKVVGAKINLPAMWVLAAITVGGNLAGPIGMLLGVPATSAARTLLKEATIRREKQLRV